MFVIMERIRIIMSIDNEETTAIEIVADNTPQLDKIHYLTPDVMTLKTGINSQTSDKCGWISKVAFLVVEDTIEAVSRISG